MDTDKLRYFRVIAQTESIRRAAELLKVTPSTLSKSVQQLEGDLGVRLITPLGRGITLTAEGKLLARKAGAVLDSIHDLKNEIVKNIQTEKLSPLRIATFEVFSTYFLETLNRVEMRERGVVLHEVVPGELELVIEQGKADLGITYLPIPHPNIEHVKVTSILMGVYKRVGTFKGIKQEVLPFVVPAFPLSGAPTRVKGLDGWPDDAYERKVKYEVTLLESAIELCRQGRCAGYFPAFIAELHNRKIRPEFKLERHPYSAVLKRCYVDVYLVKRKDKTEDKTVKMITKMIRLGTKVDSPEL